MEIVVGLLAFEYRLISDEVFVAIVFGAVISSVILGPWLSYSIKKRKEVSILEFFLPRAVIAELKTADRDGAIEALCEIAAEHEDTPDAGILYSAVLQRENAMGTAIEEGIAVPHARLAVLKRPIIIFGRSLVGIEWNSPDGKPAQFIFLILTPEGDDIQVQILALIAQAMCDKHTRDMLIEAKESQDIWAVLQKAFTPHSIIRK